MIRKGYFFFLPNFFDSVEKMSVRNLRQSANRSPRTCRGPLLLRCTLASRFGTVEQKVSNSLPQTGRAAIFLDAIPPWQKQRPPR